MKMMIIVHNAALGSDVLDILKNAGITKYTQLEEIKGRGRSSEPHLGTHIWPGINTITFTVAEDEIFQKVTCGFKKLKEKYKLEGIKVFLVPAEELI
ncbi:MAG TPA: PG0541 family transporter-associated protein [bacterium]